jgi:hypothetical protein
VLTLNLRIRHQPPGHERNAFGSRWRLFGGLRGTPALLAVPLLFAIAFAAAPAPLFARSAEAKVVVIVGPVGAVTESYRLLGEQAARAAEQAGARVTRVFTPNATWRAARTALQGASVVVYIGHGNGWPSRYRSQPAPQSQNGLGLNPVAGVDDTAHQYFGEFYLARDVRLAPGAVVVLSRLCYASGNSEPGLPEGSLSDAKQRVDNFGAGWIKSGARAVIADAFTPPAYYVNSLLSARSSVESIWRASPNNNGHTIRFASARSPGNVAQLDPDQNTSGFYRSLVIRGSARDAVGVPASQAGPDLSAQDAAKPTLAEIGFRFGPPAFTGLPTAGRQVSLKVPVAVPAGRKMPRGMIAGVRWDPLDVAVGPAEPVPLFPAPPADAGEAAGRSGSGASDADSIDAPIVPEALGEAVMTQLTSISRGKLVIRTAAPRVPGLYRLSVTLADRDGAAAGDGSEPLIPPQLVRVAGPLAASYRVDHDVSVPVDAEVALPVTVINSGSAAWTARKAARGRGEHPQLTAHWIGLDGESQLPVEPARVDVGALAPGRSASVVLRLRTPEAPGSYALVLDVTTPQQGSLIAAGAEAGLVRVLVDPLFARNHTSGVVDTERLTR